MPIRRDVLATRHNRSASKGYSPGSDQKSSYVLLLDDTDSLTHLLGPAIQLLIVFFGTRLPLQIITTELEIGKNFLEDSLLRSSTSILTRGMAH